MADPNIPVAPSPSVNPPSVPNPPTPSFLVASVAVLSTIFSAAFFAANGVTVLSPLFFDPHYLRNLKLFWID